MEITLLPSLGFGPSAAGDHCQYLTTCIVNGTIALDAGCLGFLYKPEDQARVGHLFLTHTHLDHIASLPVYLENVYDLRKEPPVVYASQAVLDVLQRDLFNDRIWPDFVALSRQIRPFLRLVAFEPGQTITVDRVQVTAVAVHHVVPTVGYLITEGRSTVAYIPDTGPTEEIWKLAAARPNLSAIIIETTFPDEMDWLARQSAHLTPAMLNTELAKLGRNVPTYIMHLKARYREPVRNQLAALKLAHVQLMQPEQPYRF